MPETVPKNCVMAGSLGVFSESTVTCFSSSRHSHLNLLHLFVFSLGLCNAGLSGKKVEVGEREAMAWESRARAPTSWV